jgi:hypothetical protein
MKRLAVLFAVGAAWASVTQADATTWFPYSGGSDGRGPADHSRSYQPGWDFSWFEPGRDNRFGSFGWPEHKPDSTFGYFGRPDPKHDFEFAHFGWPEFRPNFKLGNTLIYCFFFPFNHAGGDHYRDCDGCAVRPTPLPGALPLMGAALGIGFLMSAWAKRRRARRAAPVA